MVMQRKAQDCIGQSFDRLTVISIEWVKKNKTTVAWALCSCSCGNTISVRVYNLKNGTTKSCGCLRDETSGKRIAAMNAVKDIDGTFREPRLGSAFRVYKDHCYNDGDISFDNFLELSQHNCFYCDDTPSNCANVHKRNKYSSLIRIEQGDFIYNGLDRLDSTKLHNKNNVVPCCWDCNKAKLKRTEKVFLSWIEKVYNHSIKNKHASV